MEIGDFVPARWIGNFGVRAGDPGWLYVLGSGSRIKIGKTLNFKLRLKAARTWIPDIKVIGVKPFWGITEVERILHIALTDYWVAREWFDFADDEFKEYFLETFCEFYEKDINRNSIDFIYWMNSTGMSEFTMEYSRRKPNSLPDWRRQESYRRIYQPKAPSSN